MWGTQVSQAAFSEYLNSFHCKQADTKCSFQIIPREGAWRGGEERAAVGPKLMALPLPLTLPGGAWRGGSFIFLFLLHFQNTFLRQPGLFKEYDWVFLWEAGGGRWVSVKTWSIWDLTLCNMHQTPLESQLSGEELSIYGQSTKPSIWFLDRNELGYPRGGELSLFCGILPQTNSFILSWKI